MNFNGKLKLLTAAVTLATAQVANAAILEEVVITAQKREQSMQDVGIAVTALTGDTMRELGIGQSNEVAAQIPNVIINNQGAPTAFPCSSFGGLA